MVSRNNMVFKNDVIGVVGKVRILFASNGVLRDFLTGNLCSGLLSTLIDELLANAV